MEGHRAERVAEAMREELEEIISYELEDPRIGSVAVTEVLLAPGAREARVRLSLPDAESAAATLEALEHARHYLRREIAIRLQLRHTPEIHFEPDSTVDPARIEHLLRRARKGRPRD